MSDTKKKAPERSEVLADILKKVDLFMDHDGKTYAAYSNGTRTVVSEICGAELGAWLTAEFYQMCGKSIHKGEVQVFRSLAEKTALSKPKRDVHLRFGFENNVNSIDMGDESGACILLDTSGWRISSSVQARHVRPSGMLPLAMPQKGGDALRLLEHLNLTDEASRMLVIAFVITLPLVQINRPILQILGPKGSAKTTAARMIRSVFDPFKPMENDYAPNKRDLALIFNHNAVPLFDNVSPIPPAIADVMCKAVTGGGFQARKHYDDYALASVSFRRGFIMTAIEPPSSRSDFLDRSVIIELGNISSHVRRGETDVEEAFKRDLPGICGGCLDMLAEAMRVAPDMSLKRLPRMADFARYGAAVAEVLGFGASVFMDALLDGAEQKRCEIALSDDPLAVAIKELALEKGVLEMTTGELLTNLESNRPVKLPQGFVWPASPESLGKALSRVQGTLAGFGIELVKLGRGRNGQMVRISGPQAQVDSETGEVVEVDVENARPIEQAESNNLMIFRNVKCRDCVNCEFDREVKCYRCIADAAGTDEIWNASETRDCAAFERSVVREAVVESDEGMYKSAFN